ncbi:MAG: DUF1828 domain-containing protein [Gallionella sp.]
MNCQLIANKFAFDCTPLLTTKGEQAFELGTPFSFSDGTAINVYAIPHEDALELTDNGDTMLHLTSMGMAAWHKSKFTSLQRSIEPHGLRFTEQGEIKAFGKSKYAALLIAQFISGILAVAQMERAALGVPDKADNLADEVEMLLRGWKPQLSLVRAPHVKGISGHEYGFDFMFGDELVDVLVPHHNATGGVMRKLGDVLSSPGQHKALVIVDDRAEPGRAETELQIIAMLARAMPLSKLMSKHVTISQLH